MTATYHGDKQGMAMGLLDHLIGDDHQRRQHQPFVQRHENGAPDEGYTAQEALDQHQKVAHHLSQGQYEEAASPRSSG